MRVGVPCAYPISMTGTILHDLARTWVGKETNFKASYWQTDERIFETEEKENL